MFERFLSAWDAERVRRALGKLIRHDIGSWALTGGLAIEIHHVLCKDAADLRGLRDIDFVTALFECLPASLAQDFLFRHVHPLDPPGKTILQAVDPVEVVRIDVFRACGETMSRSVLVNLDGAPVRIVSLEDLAARTARLVLDLAGGTPTPRKYARDFLRLLQLVDLTRMEVVWQDHRKADQPASFDEVATLLKVLIASRQDLLITPEYSLNVDNVCVRCAPNSTFPLAEPKVVLGLLGYC